MEAEQERMRKAMGRDFQVPARKKSAGEIRGKPTEIGGNPTRAPGKPAVRAFSAQELAKQLTRR
jgi:hypothetical protein